MSLSSPREIAEKVLPCLSPNYFADGDCHKCPSCALRPAVEAALRDYAREVLTEAAIGVEAFEVMHEDGSAIDAWKAGYQRKASRFVRAFAATLGKENDRDQT